tara:strand:+ start:125006 stop:125446 length:441 start_codon:yes stop_codon:yes gene_type:complete
MYIPLTAYEVDPGTFVARLPDLVDDQNEHVYLICSEIISDMNKFYEPSGLYFNLYVMDYYYNGITPAGVGTYYLDQKVPFKTVEERYDDAIKLNARTLLSSFHRMQIDGIYQAIQVECPSVLQPNPNAPPKGGTIVNVDLDDDDDD